MRVGGRYLHDSYREPGVHGSDFGSRPTEGKRYVRGRIWDGKVRAPFTDSGISWWWLSSIEVTYIYIYYTGYCILINHAFFFKGPPNNHQT